MEKTFYLTAITEPETLETKHVYVKFFTEEQKRDDVPNYISKEVTEYYKHQNIRKEIEGDLPSGVRFIEEPNVRTQTEKVKGGITLTPESTIEAVNKQIARLVFEHLAKKENYVLYSVKCTPYMVDPDNYSMKIGVMIRGYEETEDHETFVKNNGKKVGTIEDYLQKNFVFDVKGSFTGMDDSKKSIFPPEQTLEETTEKITSDLDESGETMLFYLTKKTIAENDTEIKIEQESFVSLDDGIYVLNKK